MRYPPAPDDRIPALYGALLDADDQRDAVALASIGWQLFALASAAQQANCEAAVLLDELCAAARAAVAGAGSPASMALLTHVLAGHGWLPRPGATPLQVLAEPPIPVSRAGDAGSRREKRLSL